MLRTPIYEPSENLDLPENNVQYEENDDYHSSPEKGLLVQGDIPNRGNLRLPVYQTSQLAGRDGFRDHTHRHGHDDTDYKRPECLIHILSKSLGVRRKRYVAQGAGINLHPRPHTDGRKRSTQQSPKPARASRALPEHSEYDRTKQRSNEEAEQCLHIVHDARELHHQVRRTYADQ